ncbi:TPA: hypothetical protein ACG5W5_003303 [Escherichia coli]|uniref:hypothetical protein n=1 Tax=Escherichia coli TaxID=562 RepID=UPI000250D8E7|nr:hypothetical protein [Escherichia coli]EHV48141.1 hypothetical protein ECDEC6A_5541 [Escherichia coli DEC6A]
MKVQDREVVKNLLQYLTSKNLTGSVEFREALKHFNVTTVYRWENKHSERPYVVDVFAPDIECGFERHSFKEKHSADFFVRLYVRQEMMSDAYFLQTCD